MTQPDLARPVTDAPLCDYCYQPRPTDRLVVLNRVRFVCPECYRRYVDPPPRS